MSEGVRRVGIGSIVEGARIVRDEPLALSVDVDAAKGRLAELTYAQIHLQRTGVFEPFLEDPLGYFPASFLARDLLYESGDEVFNGIKDEDLYRKKLRGKIFELLAYGALSAWQPESRIILSPSDTKDFFHSLYPRHRVVNEIGGFGGIEGISVPDGLVVKMDDDGNSPRIIAALEYTKDVYTKTQDDQLKNIYKMFKNPLLRGANHTLVFPHLERSRDGDFQAVLDTLEGFNCITLNMTSSEIDAMANAQVDEILTLRDLATPEDVKARQAFSQIVVFPGMEE